MDNQLNHVFAALADPTRRAVVERLTQGPAAVSDLFAPYDMALPTFMKHLGKLEQAGLVRSVKRGRVRTIHIEAKPLAMMDDWVKQQRQMWDTRLDTLTRLAETSQNT